MRDSGTGIETTITLPHLNNYLQVYPTFRQRETLHLCQSPRADQMRDPHEGQGFPYTSHHVIVNCSGWSSAHHASCASTPLTLVKPAAISSPAVRTAGNSALMRSKGLLPFWE